MIQKLLDVLEDWPRNEFLEATKVLPTSAGNSKTTQPLALGTPSDTRRCLSLQIHPI